MEFDWDSHSSQPEGSLKEKDVEESFEDPFAVRLLPDAVRFEEQTRYFNLGKSADGQGVFTVYRTNGKQRKHFSQLDTRKLFSLLVRKVKANATEIK